MKKHILAILLIALMSPTFAHQETSTNGPEADQALNTWLLDMAKRQADAMNNSAKTGVPLVNEDVPMPQLGVHIYSIEDYPAPGAVKQSMLRSINKSKEDNGKVSPDSILTEAQARERLSKWKIMPAGLFKKYLTFTPADLSGTALATGELLDAGTVGTTLGDGRSTGLTRTYHVPGMGIVTVDEEDYPSSPSLRLAMVKESFNSQINGRFAIVRITRTTDGRGSALLRWFTPSRLYRISLLTDNASHLEQDQQVLKDIASRISKNQ